MTGAFEGCAVGCAGRGGRHSGAASCGSTGGGIAASAGGVPRPVAQLLVLQLPLSSEPLFLLLYRCAAGDFCPAGSLRLFSVAGGGGAISTAIGGWTLGKEAGSGTSATAGKLLAA